MKWLSNTFLPFLLLGLSFVPSSLDSVPTNKKSFDVEISSNEDDDPASRVGGTHSTRETHIRDLTSYAHFLVNVRDGAEVGLCIDPVSGSVRSVSTRPDGDSDWESLGVYAPTLECEPGQTPAQISHDEVYRAAARLLVHPGGPQIQPPIGSLVLVNAPTIVYLDPAEQQVTTQINGIQIQIRATPILFEWDFGDDSDPILTQDPGSPYPNHSVFYEYPKAGEYTVTLTTAWQGQWSINNQPWQTFNHHVITHTQLGTLNPRSMKARLVTGPEQ